MARRRPRSGTVRHVARSAGRDRRFDRPSTRAADWRDAVDGRAPRLGPRQYIGHDIAPGTGAWADRDPMRTPHWWHVGRWIALAGWGLLSAGSGWLSWRRHGGREFLLGRDDDA